MSNWLRRLFGLDEDTSPVDSKDVTGAHHQSHTYQSKRSSGGHFEDPYRKLSVQMKNKYPKETVTRSTKPQHHAHVEQESHRSKSKESSNRDQSVDNDYDHKQPFKLTEIPSPVYGFNKRPQRRDDVRFTEPPVDDEPEEWRVNQQEETVEEPESPQLDPEEQYPMDDDESHDQREEEQTEAQNRPATSVSAEQDIKQSAAPTRKRQRNPAIPYNVLMFRSDKSDDKGASEDAAPGPSSQPALAQDTNPVPPNKVSQSHNQKLDKPDLSLLNQAVDSQTQDEHWIEEKQKILIETLQNFNVKADVVNHIQGPAVTRFEIRLHPGVKVNKVINLTEDIKLSMAAEQIRISPVPGKDTVGIEIPNEYRKQVHLRQLLASDDFQTAASPLTAALGLDVTGQNVATDLSKMPHGLIAGATGSGKSVCIHSLILSLIYKAEPEEMRLLLIDPKVVELAVYQNLPHLASPVITQPKEASMSLKWAVAEMEERYQRFADAGVRDIQKYNQNVDNGKTDGEKMPYIVIIIDELADLMMTSPQEVEESICRIAQKARAAGIHMLVATQRPSVDVITGLIKSNIPTRIAFSVSSQADSRTILDMGGAERLLGKGDMLFAENGARDMRRVQGTFVTDDEIETVVDAFSGYDQLPDLFDQESLKQQSIDATDEQDDLFHEAGLFVIEQGQASVSSLQRRYRIGYNRAARLIDQLEMAGVVSEQNGSKPRQVLLTRDVFETDSAGASSV
ncbi:DNA translocase FtsK [Tuberibacillus sp. Marseille-P3662]|uniref:DNA translocase FtsK n=1 Tax=Tuberibacillus sp. Marseille-P3662 TaxID=1965358 RepID=UPI000A1CD2FC|nr:DNA translocase FtsK [Tuberibacillus sp. Marseille-P3662]